MPTPTQRDKFLPPLPHSNPNVKEARNHGNDGKQSAARISTTIEDEDRGAHSSFGPTERLVHPRLDDLLVPVALHNEESEAGKRQLYVRTMQKHGCLIRRLGAREL